MTYPSIGGRGVGVGGAGAPTRSTSAPSDSGAREPSTPLFLSNAGSDAGGSAAGANTSSRGKGKGKARAGPSALTGRTLKPAVGLPLVVSSIFDRSGEEDSEKIEEDVEISSEVVAMKDENPPDVDDLSGDFSGQCPG